jgi:capsule biosynthesis phosphatase
MEYSTFVIDVDGTICEAQKPEGSDSFDYENALPIQPVIEKIRELHAAGNWITLFTARGMRTYQGDRESIEIVVRPVLEEWLEKHNVPYDNLIMGKPWGKNVYYVDDRALSPADFAETPANEFATLIEPRKIKP